MKRSFVLIVLSCCLFACNSKSEQRIATEQIADAEHSLLQDAKAIDPSRADSLVSLYTNYANTYPDDTMAAAYLYRAADVMANRKECLKAVELLEKVETKYPQSDYAPQACFLKGVIYQEVCLNKEKAAECFNKFIAAYPNSPLVNDARGLLILNKAEDELELIHSWEKENQ